MDSIDEIVRKNLLMALARSKLSQVQLAEKAKLDHVGLNKILNGHKRASHSTLAKLALALGVEQSELYQMASPEKVLAASDIPPHALLPNLFNRLATMTPQDISNFLNQTGLNQNATHDTSTLKDESEMRGKKLMASDHDLEILRLYQQASEPRKKFVETVLKAKSTDDGLAYSNLLEEILDEEAARRASEHTLAQPKAKSRLKG